MQSVKYNNFCPNGLLIVEKKYIKEAYNQEVNRIPSDL